MRRSVLEHNFGRIDSVLHVYRFLPENWILNWMFQTLSLGLNMDPAVLWYVEDIRDTQHTHRLSHQPKPRLSLNVNFFSFIALFTVGHGWCRWVQRISSPPKRWPAGSSWYWRNWKMERADLDYWWLLYLDRFLLGQAGPIGSYWSQVWNQATVRLKHWNSWVTGWFFSSHP